MSTGGMRSSQELGLNGDFRVSTHGVAVPEFLSNKSREALRYAGARLALRAFVSMARIEFDPKKDADNFSPSFGSGLSNTTFDSFEWIRVFMSCIPPKHRESALEGYEAWLRGSQARELPEHAQMERNATTLLVAHEFGTTLGYFVDCIEEMREASDSEKAEENLEFFESERWQEIRREFESFPFLEDNEHTPGFFWKHLPELWAIEWVVRRLEIKDVEVKMRAEGTWARAQKWAARWDHS